jgi:hypothetical protein
MTKMLTDLERMGVYSPNEVRGEFGMAAIEGGDAHFVQSAAGLVPVELIDEVAERLIPQPVPPQLQPTSGLGTDNGPFGSADSVDENVDPNAVPAGNA